MTGYEMKRARIQRRRRRRTLMLRMPRHGKA